MRDWDWKNRKVTIYCRRPVGVEWLHPSIMRLEVEQYKCDEGFSHKTIDPFGTVYCKYNKVRDEYYSLACIEEKTDCYIVILDGWGHPKADRVDDMRHDNPVDYITDFNAIINNYISVVPHAVLHDYRTIKRVPVGDHEIDSNTPGGTKVYVENRHHVFVGFPDVFIAEYISGAITKNAAWKFYPHLHDAGDDTGTRIYDPVFSKQYRVRQPFNHFGAAYLQAMNNQTLWFSDFNKLEYHYAYQRCVEGYNVFDGLEEMIFYAEEDMPEGTAITNGYLFIARLGYDEYVVSTPKTNEATNTRGLEKYLKQ